MLCFPAGDPTALTPFQIYTWNLALLFTKLPWKKKIYIYIYTYTSWQRLPHDNWRQQQCSALVTALVQLRGRAETSHGGTELCHVRQLCSKITALPQQSQTSDKNDFPIGSYPSSVTFPIALFPTRSLPDVSSLPCTQIAHGLFITQLVYLPLPITLFWGIILALSPLPHRSTTLFLENFRLTFPLGTTAKLPGRSPLPASSATLCQPQPLFAEKQRK